MPDTPAKPNFSQHAQAVAVVAHRVVVSAARNLSVQAAQDPATVYFRLSRQLALNDKSEGDRHLEVLGEWRAQLTQWVDQLTRGLTIWAESAESSRSDGHACSASPNFELFRTVLGIDSEAPGY
jgi:hypothetical protein